MAEIESVKQRSSPIRKSVVVRRTPQEAFDIFTKRIGSWWPCEVLHLPSGCGRLRHRATHRRQGPGEREEWGSGHMGNGDHLGASATLCDDLASWK